MLGYISPACLSFAGNAASYLVIENTPSLRLGTADFTIEWWQYRTDAHAYPRVFSIGTIGGGNNAASIAVSLESVGLIYWHNSGLSNATTVITAVQPAHYTNKWTHFCVMRAAGTTRIFMNGSQVGPDIDDSAVDFNASAPPLVIGNESDLTVGDVNTAFGGYILDFTWTKGVAKYPNRTNMAVPPRTFAPPLFQPAINNATTALMLAGNTYLGYLGSAVQNVNVAAATVTFPLNYGVNPCQPNTRYNPMFNRFVPGAGVGGLSPAVRRRLRNKATSFCDRTTY